MLLGNSKDAIGIRINEILVHFLRKAQWNYLSLLFRKKAVGQLLPHSV
jgi:hypothetical protein